MEYKNVTTIKSFMSVFSLEFVDFFLFIAFVIQPDNTD